MAGVTFCKTKTLAYAKSSTNPNEIYFPTDSDSIVMNQKEYGGTATATAAATAAQNSASQAASSAAATANYMESLQIALSELPDEEAYAAEIALLKANKIQFVDLSSTTASDGHNEIPIAAHKCRFACGSDICYTVTTEHNGGMFILACSGNIPGSSSGCRYWVFEEDGMICEYYYTYANVPSWVVEPFIEYKIDQIENTLDDKATIVELYGIDVMHSQIPDDASRCIFTYNGKPVRRAETVRGTLNPVPLTVLWANYGLTGTDGVYYAFIGDQCNGVWDTSLPGTILPQEVLIFYEYSDLPTTAELESVIDEINII